MISNKILEQIEQGEKALGLAMTQPSDEQVEMAGRMGLDFVQFDGQHSPFPPRLWTGCAASRTALESLP